MAKRKSTKKEVIDTKEMEIIEISQTEEVVNNNDLNVEKEEDLLDVTEDIINEEDVTAEVDNPQMVENSIIKPIEKKNKKINPMIFGYVWNGQEFD